jgi:hypothetical protein
MKMYFPALGIFGALALQLVAQEDTAHHRELYKNINDAVAKMNVVEGVHEHEEGEIALKAWIDDTGFRKIEAKSESQTTEYYLEDQKPTFVYYEFKAEGGEKVEERLYFKDGEIFKWLTTQKDAPVFNAEDYKSTATAHKEVCELYIEALSYDDAAAEELEGTFLGIEEGDYSHWHMKTKDGVERSFFILEATEEMQKALDKPEAFKGKACRVLWKKSFEDIPEAGGKIEIEVLEFVEWVK